MITMTREEMIRKAAQTRQTKPRPTVSREALDRFPAQIETVCVQTRAAQTQVYIGRSAQSSADGPLMINLHGGGFIKEWTANDELFCRQILNRVGGCTVDIDYHLAPEYPFPTALHESFDVVQWAVTHAAELGGNPRQLILIGHSAGGNLAAGISMLAAKEGNFTPKLLIMDYPPVDLYTEPSKKEFRGGPPPEVAALYNLYYCDRGRQADPLVSPLFALPEDLRGFPTTLIITAEQDTLCAEAEEFALNLARAGTEVTLKRFPGTEHGFVIRQQPGYLDALELMERKIQETVQK